MAKFFRDSPASTVEDIQELVPVLQAKAVQAYEYAVAMYEQHGDESACTGSAAASNCIGEKCEEHLRGVRAPTRLILFCTAVAQSVSLI
jgi:hypothetical protein